MMYKQEQWLPWVEQCQDDAENQPTIESKKVKLEALLFKRHKKEMDRHQQRSKAKESAKREEEFLENAYNQRLSDMSENEQGEWDPVQDVFGYEREYYVDLIRFFLMFKDQDLTESPDSESSKDTGDEPLERDGPTKQISKSAKRRADKAAKKVNAGSNNTADLSKESHIIDMETRAQMRDRLRMPVKNERPDGWYVPVNRIRYGASTHSPAIPEDEIEPLLEEIAEVKLFIFCRLLLSHASLLRIALQANSIEEFLANDQLTQEQLRDLTLALERPSLQDVRNACADFVRGEDEDDEQVSLDNGGVVEDDHEFRGKIIPEKYTMKAASNTLEDSKHLFGNEGILNFGKVTNESDYIQKRTRIKICGRYIYDYPSDTALNRGGWFHFSIIARDSDLSEAANLCRNWNEFLN
ncbi:hypothetical protein BDV95DRAFT_313916 [Massariosphaeria phaeospora]|uniref:Uncharacterized protein n=1 Tax=Massariosphaeria phaeospora TaxID=100035 RepID=A0A7C8MCS5_9PLEO|nr:hypothetical protein BDV95DRAFT_313916 [Massariosphaeria phaeospora]